MNNHHQILINQALDRIQELTSCIDHMFLGWENRLNIYIELINQKIHLIEQERTTLINMGEHIYGEFIDLYEFDQHVYLYKEMLKIFERMKNMCRYDNRRIDNP